MKEKLSEEDRRVIRTHVSRFLKEVGFAEPPFIPKLALDARQLSLFSGDLEEILGGTLGSEAEQVDAMLQVPERLVAVRRSLTVPQQKWGCVHEVGHDYLPWHRDLLYYCSIFRLPPDVRNKLELEADIFSADAFFFGDRFTREASDLAFGLDVAKRLAEQRYLTSYYATFRRYVEENPRPCCLLICGPRLIQGNQEHLEQDPLVLKYYVKSPSYQGHIPPGQAALPNSEIYRTYYENTGQIRKHNMVFKSAGLIRTLWAESFSNSYTVFTLIWDTDKK